MTSPGPGSFKPRGRRVDEVDVADRRPGAGGIGQYLWESVRSFLYAETAAISIIVVLSVSVIDLLSAKLRGTLV